MVLTLFYTLYLYSVEKLRFGKNIQSLGSVSIYVSILNM